MECEIEGPVSYLAPSNLVVVNSEVKQDMTLINKLRVIKRCIEEKEFAHDLDIVRQIRKISLAKQVRVKEINIGSVQILDTLGEVVLNKSIINLSTTELSHLMMLVEKPIEIINRDKLLPVSPQKKIDFKKKNGVRFLSIVSKPSDLVRLKLEYNKSTHGSRKLESSVANKIFPESLSLTSNINALSIA